MLALTMEHCAVAFNPRQGLVAGERLVDFLAADLTAAPLLRQFARRLAEQEWAIYEVRRVMRAVKGKPTKMSNAVRSLVSISRGNWAEMLDELAGRARALKATVERDGAHRRAWIHRRGLYYPGVEEVLTVAPAIASDKIGPGSRMRGRRGCEARSSWR